MELNKIKEECKKCFDTCGVDFSGIEVAVNGRLTRTLGRCRYAVHAGRPVPRRIEFSRQFLETSSEESIISIIRHECAHAIVTLRTKEKHGHDAVFKECCAELGTVNDGCIAKEIDRAEGYEKTYKYNVICTSCGKSCNYSRAGKVVKYANLYNCTCGGNLKVIQNW